MRACRKINMYVKITRGAFNIWFTVNKFAMAVFPVIVLYSKQRDIFVGFDITKFKHRFCI